MKPLFALFISFILIGMLAHRSSEPRQSITTSLPQQTTAWCVIKNENYAFWDKSFDRYANYWLELFSADLSEEIREVNNLRIHQAKAWVPSDQCKTNTEAVGSLTDRSSVFTYPYRINQPKVSKPKE
ncbi:MAG: hypothetical protein AAF223_01665 [Bacteroidota bacterium]